jgi:hypothetical protein
MSPDELSPDGFPLWIIGISHATWYGPSSSEPKGAAKMGPSFHATFAAVVSNVATPLIDLASWSALTATPGGIAYDMLSAIVQKAIISEDTEKWLPRSLLINGFNAFASRGSWK